MVKDAKKFPGPHGNKKIWRYMDLPKFVDLMVTEQLYFTNLSTMTDQYEGVLPELNIKKERKRLAEMDVPLTQAEIDEWLINESGKIKSFKDFTLINCWSQNDDESYALWKIFLGGSPYGVAIRSYVRSVKKAFDTNEDIMVGTVQYKNYIEDVNQDSVILRKSPFYKYEEEVRFYLKNQLKTLNGQKKPKFHRGKRIKIDLDLLVDDIYISPFAPDWFSTVVQDLLTRINPKFVDKIKESLINDE